MDWKFNVYDFLAYLTPGVAALVLSAWFLEIDLPAQNQLLLGLASVVVGYLAGHLLHAASRCVVNHGDPSQSVLAVSNPWPPEESGEGSWDQVRRFLLLPAWRSEPPSPGRLSPVEWKLLEDSLPKSVLEKVRPTDGQLHTRELFDWLRSAVVTSPGYPIVLLFQSLYGMLRSLVLVVLIGQTVLISEIHSVFASTRPDRLFRPDALAWTLSRAGVIMLVACWAIVLLGLLSRSSGAHRELRLLRKLFPIAVAALGWIGGLIATSALFMQDWKTPVALGLGLMLLTVIARVLVVKMDDYALAYARGVCRLMTASPSGGSHASTG